MITWRGWLFGVFSRSLVWRIVDLIPITPDILATSLMFRRTMTVYRNIEQYLSSSRLMPDQEAGRWLGPWLGGTFILTAVLSLGPSNLSEGGHDVGYVWATVNVFYVLIGLLLLLLPVSWSTTWKASLSRRFIHLSDRAIDKF